MTSSIIATFDISKSVEAQGGEITPPFDVTSGFIRCVDHKCAQHRNLFTGKLTVTPSLSHAPYALAPRRQRVLSTTPRLILNCDYDFFCFILLDEPGPVPSGLLLEWVEGQ